MFASASSVWLAIKTRPLGHEGVISGRKVWQRVTIAARQEKFTSRPSGICRLRLAGRPVMSQLSDTHILTQSLSGGNKSKPWVRTPPDVQVTGL